MPGEAPGPTLDFFFFIGSTYTYLSVMRIEEVVAREGIALRWRPFDVRSIMVEQNNIPFRGKPVKMRYMWRDLERRALSYGLDWKGAPTYPLEHHALVNRVATLASTEGWCSSYVKAIYEDWFLAGRVPGEPAQMREVLGKLGRDAQEVLARASSDEIARTYLQETEVAKRLGIFGAPTFVVGDEIFWGDDRLDDAIAWANTQKRPDVPPHN